MTSFLIQFYFSKNIVMTLCAGRFPASGRMPILSLFGENVSLMSVRFARSPPVISRRRA